MERKIIFDYPEGATPLNYDEVDNLIPRHLTTQKELNEFEQFNILKGSNWAFKKQRNNILSLSFAKQLHQKMFDQTWKWAGLFRKRQINIGVTSSNIVPELVYLFGDIEFWLQNNTYPIYEIATRFHHLLVSIHPFPNGNGRYSRLYTDLLLKNQLHEVFTWKESNII